MTATKLPPSKFQRDGERYIVMCGNDHAGCIARTHDGNWNAADTTMEKSLDFPTWQSAVSWLTAVLAAAIVRGDRVPALDRCFYTSSM